MLFNYLSIVNDYIYVLFLIQHIVCFLFLFWFICWGIIMTVLYWVM